MDVTCTLSGNVACVYSVVPVLKNKRCTVASPCGGDRHLAMTQWDEIIFSAPIDFLNNLIKAFQWLENHNLGFPGGFKLKYEHELSDSYIKLGEMMGIHYQ